MDTTLFRTVHISSGDSLGQPAAAVNPSGYRKAFETQSCRDRCCEPVRNFWSPRSFSRRAWQWPDKCLPPEAFSSNARSCDRRQPCPEMPPPEVPDTLPCTSVHESHVGTCPRHLFRCGGDTPESRHLPHASARADRRPFGACAPCIGSTPYPSARSCPIRWPCAPV